MSFDWGGLVDKAKEAVENNPELVDKVKDLAGHAADSDVAKNLEEVIEDVARDHPDELKDIIEEVTKQADARDMPAAALIELTSGVINLQTKRPAPPPDKIIAAHPNFFASSDNIYQLKLTTPDKKKFSATTSAEWYQTCIISAVSPKGTVIDRTTFKGVGEGKATMRNESGSDSWTFQARNASSNRPWKIQVEFWNSQDEGGPFQASKGYKTDGIIGSEDGGGPDYNDTEVTVA